MKTLTPYGNTEGAKKDQIATMFNRIASRYDILNTLFSFGLDKSWRKKLIRTLEKEAPTTILDLATGTGELAIDMIKLGPEQIIGADISEEMLVKGREKIDEKGFSDTISMEYGDAQNLRFADNSFDAATIGFGIRNFEDPKKGLEEIFRVLKPGGTVLILELTNPKFWPIKGLHKCYTMRFLPCVAHVIARDKNAYRYLPRSVNNFIQDQQMVDLYNEVGFEDSSYKSLSLGIAALYVGKKPE